MRIINFLYRFKRNILLLCVLTLISTSCQLGHIEKEWTWIYIVNADNDLEMELMKNIESFALSLHFVTSLLIAASEKNLLIGPLPVILSLFFSNVM